MQLPLVLQKRLDHEILILTLNRPEKRNAINIEMMEQLLSIIEEAHNDINTRILILQGAGSAFCSGMDLVEATDPELIDRSSELLSKLFFTIYTSRLVTISAVHGAAIAGGAGLMAVCDLVLAAEGTKFSFPETRRGLIASLVMAFLHRQLRERDCKELLLFGEVIEAHKALHIGLINRIVPLATLQDEAVLAAKSALKGAPKATCETKKLIEKMYPVPFEDDIRKTEAFHLVMRSSDEAKEGVDAFIEKRNPSWIV